MSITNVLIYTGHKISGRLAPGLYPESLKGIRTMFNHIIKEHNRNLELYEVCGRELYHKLEKIDPAKTLLILPAGPSSVLEKNFSQKEIDRIEMVISKGMTLFGICGSAMMIAKNRTWLKNPTKKGRFSLFNGEAIAPMSPSAFKSASFYHRVVTLYLTSGFKVNLLLSGGGSFISTQSQTLATYAPFEIIRYGKDKDKNTWNQPVVLSSFGKGRVILSMVHPEYDGNEFNLEKLKAAFPERTENWEQIRKKISPVKDRAEFLLNLFLLKSHPKKEERCSFFHSLSQL